MKKCSLLNSACVSSKPKSGFYWGRSVEDPSWSSFFSFHTAQKTPITSGFLPSGKMVQSAFISTSNNSAGGSAILTPLWRNALTHAKVLKVVAYPPVNHFPSIQAAFQHNSVGVEFERETEIRDVKSNRCTLSLPSMRVCDVTRDTPSPIFMQNLQSGMLCKVSNCDQGVWSEVAGCPYMSELECQS